MRGLSCVRQTLRNRSQPFATVRNRPREDHIAVLMMVSSAKEVTFGAFQRRIVSFRVAGVALRDIPTRFITCQNLAADDLPSEEPFTLS